MFFYNVKVFSLEVYKSKLRRRINTLLIPYLIWNALALLEIAIKQLPVFSSLFPNIGIYHWNVRFLMDAFWCMPDGSCPIYYPFWYIRDLMVCVWLSPLLYWLIKRIGIFWLLALLVGILFQVKTLSGFGLSSIFFFSIGAFWSVFYQQEWTRFHLLGIGVVLWIPFAILYTCTGDYYFHFVSILCGVCTALFIGSVAVNKYGFKMPRSLIKSVFFVYATHAFVLPYVSKMLFMVLPCSNEVLCGLLLIVILIITVLLCLVLYNILNRFAPKLCGILIGGRKK